VTVLTRIGQTCAYHPALRNTHTVWEAWDAGDTFYELSYRNGVGTVRKLLDPSGWDNQYETIAEFTTSAPDNAITLAEFCERAGLTIADGAHIVHLDAEAAARIVMDNTDAVFTPHQPLKSHYPDEGPTS
jgi:hypothetical protein